MEGIGVSSVKLYIMTLPEGDTTDSLTGDLEEGRRERKYGNFMPEPDTGVGEVEAKRKVEITKAGGPGEERRKDEEGR